MSEVGRAFWLAIPVAVCGILHMVVVKARLLSFLARPLDGGATLGGLPVFGPNKTWRGVVVMIAGSALLGALQGALGGAWAAEQGVAAMDFAAAEGGHLVLGYTAVNAIFGVGYGLGELPNSFLKRRLAITAGRTGAGLLGGFFFLLDQADSVIAALVLGALIYPLPWRLVWVGIGCLTGLHLFINAALYLGKVRRNL